MASKKKYYGLQTELALKHFAIGTERWPAEMVHAQALVKIAASRANRRANKLDAKRQRAIERAAKEVAGGTLHEQFPLSIWQSGSGTQFNMNVNEVIAARANELLTGTTHARVPVHPNDHVNMSQSTNDTVPTALHIALLIASRDTLHPYMGVLRESFLGKAKEFRTIRKIGRTHLMDAVELTLGDVFSGYAAQINFALSELSHAAYGLREVPLGGTAVGTGLNSPRGYRSFAIAELNKLTKLSLKPSKNTFAAMAAHDRHVAFPEP